MIRYLCQNKKFDYVLSENGIPCEIDGTPLNLLGIVLNESFGETERGNILLTNEEEHYLNAWISLGEDHWLEISYRSDNYPSLNVNVCKCSNEKLAEHINNEFDNGLWFVSRANIEGININEQSFVCAASDRID